MNHNFKLKRTAIMNPQ